MATPNKVFNGFELVDLVSGLHEWVLRRVFFGLILYNSDEINLIRSVSEIGPDVDHVIVKTRLEKLGVLLELNELQWGAQQVSLRTDDALWHLFLLWVADHPLPNPLLHENISLDPLLSVLLDALDLLQNRMDVVG